MSSMHEASPTEIEDLVNESAMIAYHERYSKWNKLANIITFGKKLSSSTSWQNWNKEMLASFSMFQISSYEELQKFGQVI